MDTIALYLRAAEVARGAAFVRYGLRAADVLLLALATVVGVPVPFATRRDVSTAPALPPGLDPASHVAAMTRAG